MTSFFEIDLKLRQGSFGLMVQARLGETAAVLGPSPHADALRAQVTALVGREPESVGGVLLWRGL